MREEDENTRKNGVFSLSPIFHLAFLTHFVTSQALFSSAINGSIDSFSDSTTCAITALSRLPTIILTQKRQEH